MRQRNPIVFKILFVIGLVLYFSAFVVFFIQTARNGGDMNHLADNFHMIAIFVFAFIVLSMVVWILIATKIIKRKKNNLDSMNQHGFTGSETSDSVICPNCNTANPSTSQFCSRCGAVLHAGGRELPLYESTDKSGIPFSIRLKSFWYLMKWYLIILPFFLFYVIGAVVYISLRLKSDSAIAGYIVLGVCLFALVLMIVMPVVVSSFGNGRYLKERFFQDGIEVVVYNKKNDAEVARVFYSYSSFLKGKMKGDWYYLMFSRSHRRSSYVAFKKTPSYQVNMTLDNLIKKGKMQS